MMVGGVGDRGGKDLWRGQLPLYNIYAIAVATGGTAAGVGTEHRNELQRYNFF